ncbi:MAG: hypothetical protein WKF97_06155 [Chitinophagaceae bacterium]
MRVNISILRHQTFPSVAAIPFAKEELWKDDVANWHLFANDLPIYGYNEVIALWPDESIKWLHVHAIFHGDLQYTFKKTNLVLVPTNIPAIPSAAHLNWKVQVEEHDGTLWQNTLGVGVIDLPVTEYKLDCINKYGGREYQQTTDTKTEEINDPFLRITRYEGWLRKDGIQSPFRYCTRVTQYATHPLTKISHSVIFAGRMRGKKLKHISFRLPVPDSNLPVQYGVDRNLKTFLAGPARSLCVHQRRINKCEVSERMKSPHVYDRSDGFISSGNNALMVRDFWQKFPQSLEYASGNLVYRQWYGRGEEFSRVERLDEQNLHKLLHWHHGNYLENDIPKTNDPSNPEWADAYYSFIRQSGSTWLDFEEGGPAEEWPDYTDFADMQGMSIHDDFAFYPHCPDIVVAATIWNQNPVGYCDPSYIESTGVLDFGERTEDFSDLEQFMEDSVLSYTDAERFGDYGRFLYGESHRNIFYHFNRPSRHRVGLSSYYSTGETYWKMRVRGGSKAILQLARKNTEHYRSILFTSYDELTGPGEKPETKWHNIGGVWYRGLWWGNSYEIENVPDNQQPISTYEGHSDWNTKTGRIPDPDSLFWSWILDGNRNHKDGYELWYKFAKQRIYFTAVTAGNARFWNKMLTYSITAYDYFKYHPQNPLRDVMGYDDHELSGHIVDIGSGLITLQLSTFGIAGPLFHPQWIRMYAEFLSRIGGDDVEQKIADVLNFAIDNYNADFLQDNRTLDMATLLVDISLNKYQFFWKYYPLDIPPGLSDLQELAYRVQHYPVFLASIRVKAGIPNHLAWMGRLIKKIYKGSEPGWFNFGVGDAEFGDSMLKLQWGAFLKRVRALHLVNDRVPEYTFHGHYPSAAQAGGSNHPRSVNLVRDNEYWILKPDIGQLALQLRFTPRLMNVAGGFGFSEMWIMGPVTYKQNRLRTDGRIVADKFIPIYRPSDVNPDIPSDFYASHYPDPASQTLDENGRRISALEDLVSLGFFNEYSGPHDLWRYGYNWEKSDYYLTRAKSELYTIRDSVNTEEKGVYHVYINGKSVYPGLTPDGLPEVMVLNPYPTHDRLNDSGDYVFTNSRLYLKNVAPFEVNLFFWASVPASPRDSDPKKLYGSFARIEVREVAPNFPILASAELAYTGGGYGSIDSGIRYTLPPGSVIILHTTLIHEMTLVRLRMNKTDGTPGGKLLCAKSLEDIQAFDVVLGDPPDTD